ncbi:hypothetical protein [Merismopedia glauca]|uniref:hypothetical protein n=1 Tax=Merismopedia glauca TaxID=292586 RepID=UPI0011B1D0FF|nr:hypothetical protein [Merismopedia glauca]
MTYTLQRCSHNSKLNGKVLLGAKNESADPCDRLSVTPSGLLLTAVAINLWRFPDYREKTQYEDV